MKFWNKIRNQMFVSRITRSLVNTKELKYMVDQVMQFVFNKRNILFRLYKFYLNNFLQTQLRESCNERY